VEKKFSLQRLNEALSGFVTKRGRMVKLTLAILAVMLLSGILYAFIIAQIASNYETNSTIPNQVTPNYETNSTIPNQVTPNYQTNSTTPNQIASNYETNSTIPNAGSLKTIGIGVYWDAGLTNSTNAIDWGMLEPGTQKSFTIYTRNEGNSPITMSMSTSNWNPSTASSYLTLTWNYNDQTINPGASVQVTLTLTVSASITGINSFSFDIIAAGSG
jgi:cytoskeletal protein RodZ